MGVSYTGRRASGRVKATATRPLADTPRLIADDPSYSIDVGGSYSLTRNLDLTAGVRYKSEHDRDRRQRIADDRHDSQAVRAEEDTSELQSLMSISYAVVCLSKKKKIKTNRSTYIESAVQEYTAKE